MPATCSAAVLALCLLFCPSVLPQGMHQPHHAVWPHPKLLTHGHDDNTRTVTPRLKLSESLTSHGSDIVSAALQRYHDYLFSEKTGGLSQWQWGPTPGAPPRKCANVSSQSADGAAVTPLAQLSVTVKRGANASAEYAMGSDESYTLDIPLTGDATLTAATPVGALRGLETFSQLCLLTHRQCEYRIPQAPIHIEVRFLLHFLPRVASTLTRLGLAGCAALDASRSAGGHWA